MIYSIPVNKLFDKLNENWGGDRGKKWLDVNHIQKSEYRNGQLNGNSCKKLLEKLSNLKTQVPKRLWKYIVALDKFNEVRKSCFGQVLNPNYKQKIEDFKKAYEKLNIPMTNKVHVLVVHVPEYCDKKKQALGVDSEQALYVYKIV